MPFPTGTCLSTEIQRYRCPQTPGMGCLTCGTDTKRKLKGKTMCAREFSTIDGVKEYTLSCGPIFSC